MWQSTWIWGSPLTSKPGALKGLAVFWRGSAEVNENQAPAADPSEVRLSLFNPPFLPLHTLSPPCLDKEKKNKKIQ